MGWSAGGCLLDSPATAAACRLPWRGPSWVQLPPNLAAMAAWGLSYTHRVHVQEQGSQEVSGGSGLGWGWGAVGASMAAAAPPVAAPLAVGPETHGPRCTSSSSERGQAIESARGRKERAW